MYYVLFLILVNKKIKNSVILCMVDLNENTNVNIPLRNLLGLIFAVAVSVTGYVNLTSRITQLEHGRQITNVEVSMNSEFRVKWPRGELGALPADANQDLRLNYIEKRLEMIDELSRQLEIEVHKAKVESEAAHN